MAGRGRGGAGAGIAQMRRDMQNLERRVAELTNALANQRTIQRDVSDEETKYGSVDHQGEQDGRRSKKGGGNDNKKRQ